MIGASERHGGLRGGLGAHVLPRLEGTDHEDRTVDEGRDDRRISHGHEQRAVDNDAIESLAEFLHEATETVGLQEVCRDYGAAAASGTGTSSFRHDGRLRHFIEGRLADECAGQTRVTGPVKDPVKARPTQVRIDYAHTLFALGERDGDAAGDRGLAFREGLALDTRSSCRACRGS